MLPAQQGALSWTHGKTDVPLAHTQPPALLPPAVRSGWAARGQQDAWQQLRKKKHWLQLEIDQLRPVTGLGEEELGRSQAAD